MASPLLTSQRLLFVLAVVLLINSQLPAAVGGLAGRILKPVVDFAVMPVQRPLHHLAVNLRQTEEADPPPEGALTRQQLEIDYELALVEIDKLQQQVNELRRRLTLVENVAEFGDVETRPLSAQVNAYTDTGPAPVLTINRGSRHGVEAGMTVVYHASIVGRVIEPVGPVTADVQLITAHDAGLYVRIRPLGSDLKYDNIRVTRGTDGQTFVAQVAYDSPIRGGADVLLADAVHYPDARGRLLGVVEKVAEFPEDPTLFKQLVIRPAVDLKYLKEVAVLLPVNDPAPQGAPPE